MNRFYLIFKFLFDKNIPLREKWWVIIPSIYILSPADLIPAPILGFSLIDDGVMLLYLLSVVVSKTNKYYGTENKNQKTETNKSYINEKDIVENVDYEIKDDEE